MNVQENERTDVNIRDCDALADAGTLTSLEIGRLLSPTSIAIIGASQDTDKFGGRLIEVLQLHGFPGTIYPISTKRSEIFGLKAYPTLTDVAGEVDLAVLCVPQHAVLDVFDDCVAKGVRLCIVISSKFAEAGAEGEALEKHLLAKARRHGIRILGPNCLGFISRPGKIVLIPSPALYTHVPVPPGNIGMISQSGALAATMLDIAAGVGLGFSYAVATGNQLDLTAADFIRFLADDRETGVICCYLEGVRDFSSFLEALRYARERSKPVILLKAGRTAQGSEAAYTHTASLATDYDAFAAYVEQAGAILVQDPKAMLTLAGLLDALNGSAVDDVIMVTNSGGGAAIVADRLSDCGVKLRDLSADVTERLKESYFASHARNPLDWGGTDLPSEDVLLERTFTALAEEKGHPLVLIVFLTNPNMRRTAEILASHVRKAGHPVLILVMPDKAADVSREVFRGHQIGFADGVDEIVDAIATVVARGQPKPSHPPRRPSNVPSTSPLPIAGALDHAATQHLLKAYGIPVTASGTATSKADAMSLATSMGYPVAVKLIAEGISHKSELRGVELDIANSDALVAAWNRIEAALGRLAPDARMEGVLVQRMVRGELECLVGIKDAVGVGPVAVFGAGGTLAELLQETAVLPVPCSAPDVGEQLSRLKIARLLAGYRGKPLLDFDSLVDVIVRASWLGYDLRGRLAELDLNPVIVGVAGAGATAVDVRARFYSVPGNAELGSQPCPSRGMKVSRAETMPKFKGL